MAGRFTAPRTHMSRARLLLALILALPLCWVVGLWMQSGPARRAGPDGPAHAGQSQSPGAGWAYFSSSAGAAASAAWSSSSGGDWVGLRRPGSQPSTTSWWPWSSGGRKEARQHRFSIKPVVYVFPQFHAIPENDVFWGVNFTEWDNVRKVTTNAFQGETLHPAAEVGYYDYLAQAPRKRQARFIRESGAFGLVYHHYWFGRPVMDGVLQRAIDPADGEPDVPFMLSWANEPWTARWDGQDSSRVLLRQRYGDLADWRAHFEYLLPFFRHRNYIRRGGTNGGGDDDGATTGNLQFVVYNPAHIGQVAPRMYAAFRQWAVEAGLGGLDIIETRIGGDSLTRYPSDAVNEFAPRTSAGTIDHTRWPWSARVFARVFHRGTGVCWDNTPRHATDGGASTNPMCHPRLWEEHLVELMRRIKADPNEEGQDNFLFINALNEWGEGNVLEPTAQWGDRYGRALRNAMDRADRDLPWKHHVVARGLALFQELARAGEVGSWSGRGTGRGETAMPPAAEGANPPPSIPQHAPTGPQPPPDVCVLVRVFQPVNPWSGFGLATTLRSLAAQRNANWRAVVYSAGNDDAPFESFVQAPVLETYDPRVAAVQVPGEVARQAGALDQDGGAWNTDWILANLGGAAVEAGGGGGGQPAWRANEALGANSTCGAARYVVFANASDAFHPLAFDLVAAGNPLAQEQADLIGLTVESKNSMERAERNRERPLEWNERCDWLRSPETTLCQHNTILVSRAADFDPAAVLVSLPKLRSAGLLDFSAHALHRSSSSSPFGPRAQELTLLTQLVNNEHWTWAQAGALAPAGSGSAAAAPFDGTVSRGAEDGAGTMACHVQRSGAGGGRADEAAPGPGRGSWTSCRAGGRWWVDSPLWDDESGCYGLNEFVDRFSWDLSAWDMSRFRSQDPFCLRYNREAYLDKVRIRDERAAKKAEEETQQ